MSRQIIQQPDLNFCIFSTIVDNTIGDNLTKEKVIEFFLEEHRRYYEGIFEELEAGGKPYRNFQMTYQEMTELIKRIHGSL